VAELTKNTGQTMFDGGDAGEVDERIVKKMVCCEF